jgi:hypothetical protein
MPFAFGSIQDRPARATCAANAEVCDTAPGAPIGGCAPQHASIAAATQMPTARPPKFKLFI